VIAGKPRGFAFAAYEDQRSTVLAVDNLSGARVAGRTIRVEHVDNYKRKRAEVLIAESRVQHVDKLSHVPFQPVKSAWYLPCPSKRPHLCRETVCCSGCQHSVTAVAAADGGAGAVPGHSSRR
jgi:RNA recognition motif. (a.k.a. RRM, RBD, or RNP domain)